MLWKNRKPASQRKLPVMPNQYSLPVVHPAFELLKRSARILHFIAASVILASALFELKADDGHQLMAYTQLVIAADIYLLIFLGGPILVVAPRLNLIFRVIEALTILGIGATLAMDGLGWLAFAHVLMGAGYAFLFYREWRVIHSEAVDIKPTGITLPNFVKDAEIGWNEVKAIMPKYHSIIIETLRNKRISFQLRSNLKIEELEQIDDFCQKHMGAR